MRFLPAVGQARRAVVALALAGAACDNPLSPTDDLEEARRRWRREGVASYSFTVTQSCFCVEDARGPFRVTVSGGAVVSVADPGSGAPRAVSEFVPLTVEALFDRVQMAIDEDDELDVRYDADLGYPRRIEINLSQQPVDGGLEIEASGLTPTR